MNVFLTGATGFIGSALIPELLKAGHHVRGLARSDESTQKLTAAGAEAHRGSLEDLDSLKRRAAADGIIHLGFVHDFANFTADTDTDRRAINALAGSKRPPITTRRGGQA